MGVLLKQDEWVLISQTYLGNSGGDLYVRLWAKLWGSEIESNRSYVYIEAWAYYTGGWIRDNQGSGYVTDGTNTSSGSCTYLTTGETKIAGIEGWYTHNNDGTLDLYSEAHLNFPNWGWSGKASAWAEVPSIPRQATITSAPNFTDEDSPTVTFNNPAGSAVTVQVCISWTGGADIAYRTINNPTDTSYTFNFTQSELDALYDATLSGSNSRTVTFYVTTIIGSTHYYSTLQRTFTVVNCTPTLEAEVLDYGDTSTSITGDPNILLKHFNYPRAVFNASAKKRASIVSKTVTCGGQTITAAGEYAQFNNVDNNAFIFTIVDSRGNKVSKTITKDMIGYITPTCRATIDTDLQEENTANINVNIVGKYYKGSLGSRDNTLTVEYRYKTINGEYPIDENGVEVWTPVSATISGTEYSAKATIENVDYRDTYIIQTRARDVIYTWGVQAKDEIVKIVPVFDWSENDFNFNVPVNVNGRIYKEGNPVGYYPIGGIYTSSNSTNPGELFGGTWQQVRAFYGGELIAYSTTWNTADKNGIRFNVNSNRGISDIFYGENASNHICNYIPNILTSSSGTILVQTQGIVGLVEAYVEVSGAADGYCYGIWFKNINLNDLPASVVITGGGSIQSLGHDPSVENYQQSHSSYVGTSSRYFYNVSNNDTGSSFFVNPVWSPYGNNRGTFMACTSAVKSVLQVKAYAKCGTTYMWKRIA